VTYKHCAYCNIIAITEGTKMHRIIVCPCNVCVLHIVTVMFELCIVCILFCIVPFMYSLISLSVSV
jgi:hypothetical protein